VILHSLRKLGRGADLHSGSGTARSRPWARSTSLARASNELLHIQHTRARFLKRAVRDRENKQTHLGPSSYTEPWGARETRGKTHVG
jgi:hypothetical protein